MVSAETRSVQDNEINEFLWDFEIKTKQPILTRKPGFCADYFKKELVFQWVSHFKLTTKRR